MKVSVCVTTFNEERSVGDMLMLLSNQTLKPDEVIVVDSQSSDTTCRIVENYSKNYKNIKLKCVKCTRAEGRNIAVRMAKNEVIAMTDAGCTPRKDWLKNITKPFVNKKTDVAAGFYQMFAHNDMQNAMTVFMGVLPQDFTDKFLPSTRSIAFTKTIWKKVGGFPEDATTTAEDMIFNYRLTDNNAKFVRVKDARVEWRMPESVRVFGKKLRDYAKGDAKSGVLYHKSKGFASHNIKVMTIFARYLLFLGSLSFLYFYPVLIFPLTLFFLYIYWAFYKVFSKTGMFMAGIWGVILQFVSDFNIMAGFLAGVLS